MEPCLDIGMPIAQKAVEPNAHGLTKRAVTLCLTNDPSTLNCNLFRTCRLAYVGIETMRLMDNTY